MIVLGFQLTVELILILPFGGIVRTMQRNSDPWSRRVGSELFSTICWVFFSEEKETSEGNVTLALITVDCSNEFILFTGSSGISAAKLGCLVLETWASAFPKLLIFCACQGKDQIILISPADIKQSSQLNKKIPYILEKRNLQTSVSLLCIREFNFKPSWNWDGSCCRLFWDRGSIM